MLASVLPDITECTPHELLPIMPPSVHHRCVAGSGPNVRPTRSASSRRRSSTTPGCTRACRLRGIDGEDAVAVPREIEDHRHVAALPRQAGAGAAREDGRAELAAYRHGGHDVVGVAGADDPDRHLPVVGRIGRVQRAAGRVEPHLAPDGLPQAGLERAVHGGVGVKRRRRNGRRWMCGHGDPGGGAPALPPARRYQHTRGVRICER